MNSCSPIFAPLNAIARFAALWLAIFILLLVGAAAEGAILWVAGFRYIPKDGFEETHIAQIAISADGRWGASRVGFRSTGLRGDVVQDVVLLDLDRGEAQRVQLSDLQPELVALCPSAGTLAIGCADGAIYTRPLGAPLSPEAAAAPPVRLARFPGPVTRIVYSAKGTYLAAADRRQACVWSARTGATVFTSEFEGGGYPCVAFSADERYVLVPHAENELHVWELKAARCFHRIRLNEAVLNAALSPFMDHLAVLVCDGTMRMIDLKQDREIWRSAWKRIDGQMLEFTSDGKEICAGGAEGRITLREVRTGEPRAPLERDAILLGYVSGPGGQLYSWGRRGDICVWSIDHRRPVRSFSLLEWARKKPWEQALATGSARRGDST